MKSHFHQMFTENVLLGDGGNYFRQIRNERNISIDELANLSNITYSQVS